MGEGGGWTYKNWLAWSILCLHSTAKENQAFYVVPFFFIVQCVYWMIFEFFILYFESLFFTHAFGKGFELLGL